jgi:hypothetical protein
MSLLEGAHGGGQPACLSIGSRSTNRSRGFGDARRAARSRSYGTSIRPPQDSRKEVDPDGTRLPHRTQWCWTRLATRRGRLTEPEGARSPVARARYVALTMFATGTTAYRKPAGKRRPEAGVSTAYRKPAGKRGR